MAEQANSNAGATSSGVDALIARLRDQGVEAGREQAARLVKEAEQTAEKTMAEAKDKAKRKKDMSRKRAKHKQKG